MIPKINWKIVITLLLWWKIDGDLELYFLFHLTRQFKIYKWILIIKLHLILKNELNSILNVYIQNSIELKYIILQQVLDYLDDKIQKNYPDIWNPDNENLKWNHKIHGIQGSTSKKIPVIKVLIIEDLLTMANTSQFLFKIIVHT